MKSRATGVGFPCYDTLLTIHRSLAYHHQRQNFLMRQCPLAVVLGSGVSIACFLLMEINDDTLWIPVIFILLALNLEAHP
ncbi:hypothetical protein C4K03_4753 [Pseudomonas synxantha]|uniref:Uncharacterized protein n=1 Tax=Pseudomonas synxantha TaxID=47883 RepID=A0A3G7UCF9_9PSED|nr:hypothetical protein C4K03_4753 [Pseudomonas synxantha]